MRRFATESGRCIGESMADAAARKFRKPMKVSITHLSLDDAEAAELMVLFKPVDEFIARASEKCDRDPVGTPRRCKYHVAPHVVPLLIERLPPARMAFASRGAGVPKVGGEYRGARRAPAEPPQLAARLCTLGER